MPAAQLATASYATRRGLTRPFARKTAQHRRLGQKLSIGLSAAQAARLEGLAPQAVETLLTEPDFSALVQGYKALDTMPEEEQRRILTQLARHLLMEAAALGDIRVACFILREEQHGRDPARTLADGVIAAKQRAARPAPAAPVSPGLSRARRDPDDRMIERVETRLRGELQQEHAAVEAVTADEMPAAAEAAGNEPEVSTSCEPDEA
ncbi:MAG TPA: hypothetical protein VEY31_00855, partial [Roseococcus sp.]|nr:hypothetical protein [Roseococcus sp.]